MLQMATMASLKVQSGAGHADQLTAARPPGALEALTPEAMTAMRMADMTDTMSM